MHREPAESWHTFKGATFHPLQEAPEQQLQLAPPPDAAPQSMTTAAGVLVSRDAGATWQPLGDIEVRCWVRCWVLALQALPPAPGCVQLQPTRLHVAPPRPQDAKTWLVNPVLEEGSQGQLIMLFRTAAGAPLQRA